MTEQITICAFLIAARILGVAIVGMGGVGNYLLATLPNSITDDWKRQFGKNLHYQFAVNIRFIVFLYKFFLGRAYRGKVDIRLRRWCELQRLFMGLAILAFLSASVIWGVAVLLDVR